MNTEEIRALTEMRDLMNQACDDTPRDVTEEDIVNSGWLEKLQPKAFEVIDVFLKRGRSAEEEEEIEPSFESGEAWRKENLTDF